MIDNTNALVNLGSIASSNRTSFIKLIENSETTYDIFRILKQLTLYFGYEKFIIMKLPSDIEASLAEVTITTNWDPELIRAYDAMGLNTNSPIIQKLRKSVLPIHWEIDTINNDRNDGKKTNVHDLFKDFGLIRGVYVSVSDKSALRGAVGLSGSRANLNEDELMCLSYISSFAFEKLTNFEGAGSKAKDQLTDRERECVFWTAAGKTSGEVGIILDISENTVNHYLSSAALKLGAVNKAHTVAKALRLGILER
jgi:LuxR family transcriptional regulator, quorum-sensing system regulator BjaR1